MNNELRSIRSETGNALKLAKNDRCKIVPILGAGLSMPIGLPTWAVLVNRLAESANMSVSESGYSHTLLKIRQKMGEAEFVKRIQHELSIPPQATTLTLQALVQADPQYLVTTNLDYAVENAFRLAMQPLTSHSILCGTPDDLSLFGIPSETPQLLKLHGSLERPWTWILTSDEYDWMYAERSMVQELIRHRIGTPLFLGFSLNDDDIKLCLRMARVWNVRSYAALRVNEIATRRDELNQLNIIPIPFDSFDQLPEIVDEILGCRPVQAEIHISCSEQAQRLFVGAATISVPNSLVNYDAPTKSLLVNALIGTLRNAVDGRPMHSLVDNQPRRDSGQKKNYLKEIRSLVERSDDPIVADLAETAVSVLINYQDLFFEALLPHVLSVSKNRCFEFLSMVYKHLDDHSRPRLEKFLIDSLDDSSLAPRRVRDIAKQLALRGAHPALMLPPPGVYFDNLFACKYPLTRYQVGQLLSDQELIREQSVRPYTLHDLNDVYIILERLFEKTGHRWRLPTKEEWIMLASLKPNAWPWGEDLLNYQAQAHLNFLGMPPAEGPIEVGCFPKGASPEGLVDLIGNVYELLDAPKSQQLAGGAWTTNVHSNISINNFRLFRKLGGKANKNIGLRPVCEQ
ncbi:hypothetical protein FEI13_18410 [Halomonas urmiana]|uniref:SIR2-like domain-containing protein n=1 Tax=Halomonas urmiana TaxID=490901 RepID=A0A5R8M8L0_9GAMM|nr:SIR2 family protein [Halomonas urmiana]TLF45109.1 hypothetical protein FEI13_18410 [Halomonas urmiana]